jgi:hypothetical protein
METSLGDATAGAAGLAVAGFGAAALVAGAFPVFAAGGLVGAWAGLAFTTAFFAGAGFLAAGFA